MDSVEIIDILTDIEMMIDTVTNEEDVAWIQEKLQEIIVSLSN